MSTRNLGLARETLHILEYGRYTSASGTHVDLSDDIAMAVGSSLLYTPNQVKHLPLAPPPSDAAVTRCEVTPESTTGALRRLYHREGQRSLLALNFASAKNPGGGFLKGATAQEEDLARGSALYACQLACRSYYDANRAWSDALYTDHLIYSPELPFFRDERNELVDEAFYASVITSPAPNAGAYLSERGAEQARLEETLTRRADQVLRVAAQHGHRCLVLGAWGCGVFRNDPMFVAEVFRRWLAEHPGVFARVVFAVYERRGKGPNLDAFRHCFEGSSAE